MPYIPKEHKKYDLLPFCREHGGEVFSYSSTFEIEKHLPKGVILDPYGYKSYEEYYDQINEYINLYGTTDGKLNKVGKLLRDHIADTKKRNVKENWSVVQYVGESTGGVGGFTHGRYYYWPCSIENPVYEGVIDDVEYTSYIAWDIAKAQKAEDCLFQFIKFSEWIVAEDPTGMAKRTLNVE